MQKLNLKLPIFTDQYEGSLMRALVRALEQAFQRVYYDNTRPVTEVSADYTLVSEDSFLLVDSTAGDIDITVPERNDALVMLRRTIIIKKLVAGNAVNIIASGSDTVDGAASITLSAANSAYTIRATPDGWVSI